MSFYFISALINVVTSLVIAVLVLLADRRSKTNLTFAAFALSITFWAFSYFLWQIAVTADSALFWSHMFMAGAICITPIYFHFVASFLNAASRYRTPIIAGYVFIAIFALINWLPDLYIAGVEPRGGFEFWPVAGPLFVPFLIGWLGYVAFSEWLLLKASMAKEYATMRGSILYVLVGTTIGYIGGSTNYFLWFNVPIPPVGNILVAAYVLFVAFAILKHRLFNMRVVAAEFFVFVLWLVIFVRMLLAESQSEQLIELGVLLATLVVGVLLIRSVNQEVEQRERIEIQEKELERVNMQQESLLHFISHEVKGYLTKSQAAFAAILSGDYGDTTPELREMARYALDDVRKGVDTVINILDASNLKRGVVSYQKKPFDLVRAVDEIVHDLQQLAEERRLELHFDKPVTGAYGIIGDEEKIRRHVIRNLIDNSLRYTLHGSVRVELSRNKSVVRLMVQDTGVGITPQDMHHLFTEGGKGLESLKVNVHSTGYGLFIAKQIVEGHGGKIWAESDGKDKGSRFIAEFPAV